MHLIQHKFTEPRNFSAQKPVSSRMLYEAKISAICLLIFFCVPSLLSAQSTTGVKKTTLKKSPVAPSKRLGIPGVPIPKKSNINDGGDGDGGGGGTCTKKDWVLDADNDGYYTGPVANQCETPGAGYIEKNNQQPGDCNDDNAAINPTTPWVSDADNDGFYTGDVIRLCTSPGNDYAVLTNQQPGDCDDTDPNVQTRGWVLDMDNDGYGTGSVVFSCTSPGSGYRNDPGLPLGDCDDNNSLINPTTQWVIDADNDGQYPGDHPIIQCASPGLGYVILNDQLPGDCDDNDPTIKLRVWLLDNDNDGYGVLPMILSCNSPGSAYKSDNKVFFLDCDDNDPLLNHDTKWVLDADNDGYYIADPVNQCTSPGNGFVLLGNQVAGDCNDNDPAVNVTKTWYQDIDNDGYAGWITKVQCTRPQNYKLQSELISTALDCEDDDYLINPATQWVMDKDEDGYYIGNPKTSCTSPGAGYVVKNNQNPGDCDDNNANINYGTVWYKDVDNDGYSSGFTIVQCKRPKNCKLASELIATSGDCKDNNPLVHPGATEICGNKIDDNCNGLIDEDCCTNISSGGTYNITSGSAQLRWTAPIDAVQWQIQFKTKDGVSAWIDRPAVDGTLRSATLSNLQASQNYLWHIRALCGNVWTNYSSTFLFKTLPKTRSRPATEAKTTKPDEKVIITERTLKIYPNPTTGTCMITLQSGETVNAKTHILLSDMTGRTVYTLESKIENGLLKQQINIPGKLVKGTYLIRVVVADKTYKGLLVYAK